MPAVANKPAGARKEPSTSEAIMTSRQAALLALLYLSYVINVMSQSSLEIAMPLAANDTAVALNAADFSNGLAWGQLTTITGKIATGSVLAVLGPTEAFCGSLAGMGVLLASGVMAVVSGAHAMAMLSFILYKLMKSTVWTTLALLTKSSFGPHLVGRVWPLLTTSSRAGAVLGGLLLSPIGAYGWSAPIMVVAVSLVALSVVVRVHFLLPSSAGTTPAVDKIDDTSTSRGGGMQQSVTLILADGQLGLLFLAQAMCLPVMECSNLLPTFLSVQLGMSVAQAGQVASAFPMGMVASTFLSGVFFDTLGAVPKSVFLLTVTGSGAIAAVLLGMMEQHTWLVPFLLALLGASLAPAMYLKPGPYVMRHVDESCAPTVLALIDTPGYLVSAILFQLYPQLIASGGWPLIFSVLAVMIGVAGLSLSAQQTMENQNRLERKRDKQD